MRMVTEEKVQKDAEVSWRSSFTSITKNLTDWLEDLWPSSTTTTNRTCVEDVVIFGLIPVSSPENYHVIFSAMDFHPFSWLALGIMLCSSQLIASRAEKYKLQRHELAQNASQVLLISSVVQAAVCSLEYMQLMHPLATSFGLCSPFLIGRFVQDAMILPLWVTSIGRSMSQPHLARMAYSYAGVGNLFQLAAVWCCDWSLSKIFLIPSACCIGIASYRVLQWYDPERVPVTVRFDMQSSSYLLVFYMVSGFMIEVLGVSHEIGEQQMLLEYAVLDVVGKVPSCHLLTRALRMENFGEINLRDRLDAVMEFEDEELQSVWGPARSLPLPILQIRMVQGPMMEECM